jgi:hypothetical protein
LEFTETHGRYAFGLFADLQMLRDDLRYSRSGRESGGCLDQADIHAPREGRNPVSFQLEYCEPEEPQCKAPIVREVQIHIEHPFRYSSTWTLLRKMREPGWYLVTNGRGTVLALHESQFSNSEFESILP